MTDREKVIKELHDARRYLEDKEWSDRGASPHIDAITNAIDLLKEDEETISNLNKTVKNLLQHITDINDYMTPYGKVKDVKAYAELLKEQEDLGTELTNAIELIRKKNERIKKLEEQIETLTKWRMNSGAFD